MQNKSSKIFFRGISSSTKQPKSKALVSDGGAFRILKAKNF
jgi:hypothetical protein